jgi:dihydrofolate synthase / folylpolyglutamate synthase
MTFTTMKHAEDMIYQSYMRAAPNIHLEHDEVVRNPELTRRLLDLIGKPDLAGRNILVTGSKGKGSTSRMIASLLGHLGYKVGLFTSPHILHFNERIRVNGKSISEKDFIRLANRVAPLFQEIEKTLPPDCYQGPVGVALSIALLYFNEQITDVNIIECGRGGKYDDTNVIANETAVITPIMEEHLNHLGPTLDDIIVHKLGIVKEKTNHVVVSKQLPYVQEVIKEKLKSNHVNAFYYGNEFQAFNIEMRKDGVSFSAETTETNYGDLFLSLLGEFQGDNAVSAIKACEIFLQTKLPLKAVKKCLQEVKWPGRCEIIDHSPAVIVDGTIHRESAKYVKRILKDSRFKHIVSILAVPEDKDYKGVIQEVASFSKQIIITRPTVSHKTFPKDALAVSNAYLLNSSEVYHLEAAVQKAKADPNIDCMLILGTQTFISDVKKIWKQSLADLGI